MTEIIPLPQPQLSLDRLDQMIHLATSHVQEPKILRWHQRMMQGITRRKTGYGLATAGFGIACLAAFWLAPAPQVTHQPKTEVHAKVAISDANLSEYMLIELFDDLG